MQFYLSRQPDALKFKIDPFVIAIIVVVAMAYIFPVSAYADNILDGISTVGISLIFLFYGLKLSHEKLVSGLKNWKLHLLVHTTTFMIFPLIVLAFRPLVTTENGFSIWLAFLFLASLPSTVSSSVVMVSMAGGNVPAAIFNASLSGLLGIVITPLWMGLFLNHSDASFDFTGIYTRLFLQIIVPVIAGLLLRRYLGNYAQQFSRELSMFDRSMILLIVYKSFAASFGQKVFSHVTPGDLLMIFAGTAMLFYVVFCLTAYLSGLLGFNREDRIVAQYCGTKKSLVHGTVFSKILFQENTAGLTLLPLMVFHALQIFIISVIASGESARAKSSQP